MSIWDTFEKDMRGDSYESNCEKYFDKATSYMKNRCYKQDAFYFNDFSFYKNSSTLLLKSFNMSISSFYGMRNSKIWNNKEFVCFYDGDKEPTQQEKERLCLPSRNNLKINKANPLSFYVLFKRMIKALAFMDSVPADKILESIYGTSINLN